MKNPIYLGVNIDHVATLRQVRGTIFPDPVQAAFVSEQAGADGITVHLREDKRHIQPRDVELLRQTIQTKMNLEMAVTESMLQFAMKIKPQASCLVPEKREELTTEGGLNVLANEAAVARACAMLADIGSEVSLFIDADFKQIEAAKRCNAPVIEIHTGHYADATTEVERLQALQQITDAVAYAHSLGLIVNAGHGLHYHNVQAIAAIPQIHELNIGHAIVANAVFMGLDNAVREMKRLMVEARTW